MKRWVLALLGCLLCMACSGGQVGEPSDAVTDGKGEIEGDGGLIDALDGVPGEVEDVSANETADSHGSDNQTDGVEPSEGWLPMSLEARRRLRGVWSDGNVWVTVGDKGSIFWKNEGQWAPAESPTSRDLYAVYGETLESLYAVGEAGTVVRYDGGEWRLEETLLEGLEDVVLRGVWGESGHLYVVGDRGTVLHKIGENWTKEQSLVTYTLYAVWGESLLDVYAAGGGGALLKKSSQAWTSLPLTSGSVSFQAVTGQFGGALVAAGSGGSIVRQDASGFVQDLSNDTQNRDIQGAWMYSEGDVWLVGIDGALIHREGGKWLLKEIDGPNFRNESFFGVWGSREGVAPEALAVGERGAGIRFDGKIWTDELIAVRSDLEDLDGLSTGEALAVGTQGTLLAWDGVRWFGLPHATSSTLHGVAAFDGGFVAVGDQGTVVRVVDGKAVVIDAGIEEDLYGVCTRSEKAMVVGEEGTVYRSDDLVEWTRVETNRFDLLRDCAIEKSGVVVVVGDSGVVLRLLNNDVGVVPVATMVNLRRSVVGADGTLTIVGDNGLVLRGSGTSLEPVHQKPGSFLYGVTATVEGFAAVGWGGEVVEGTSDGIRTYSIDDAGVLLQIWADPEGNLLSVGREGRAYRKTF